MKPGAVEARSARPAWVRALLAASILAWGGAHAQPGGLTLGSGPAPAAPAGLDSLPPLRSPQSLGAFVPETLAYDGLGRIFALDRSGARISRISAQGSWIRFGVGDQGGDRYPNLTALFAQWGPDLFALDPVAGFLYHCDLDGYFRERISYGDGLSAAGLQFVQPAGFALTKAGELLLLDHTGRLFLFDRTGSFVTDFAAGAAGDQRLQAPTRIALDGNGEIYILDPPGGWVRRFSREGTLQPAWRYTQGLAAAGTTDRPLLGVTPWGHVVVAGSDGSWLRVFDPDGHLLFDHEGPPAAETFTDLVAAPDSILYWACPARGEIRRMRWVYPAHVEAGPR